MKLHRINKIALNRHPQELYPATFLLPESIMKLLRGGIVEREECLFLSELFKKCPGVRRESFYDRTAYECFVNHFHVEEHVKKEESFMASVVFLSEVSKIIRQFYDYPVLGIIGEDECGVSVRFHRIRSEEKGWLLEDLDGYDEGICEYEM